jgi:predicted ATPase
VPFYLSCLARAYAELGQFDAARRAISEATAAFETTGELCWEAEIHRVAGELALMSPSPDIAKAKGDISRALSVAQKQQAKSWELRAATSMARLWCDRGKSLEARELLAPVYGWFTEGFDTLDLKGAKVLLDTLPARGRSRSRGPSAMSLIGSAPRRHQPSAEEDTIRRVVD